MNELEKLYKTLTEKGYYTKSFEEFQEQYSDDSYKKKVYDVVSRDQLYTKDYDSFINKYSSEKKKNLLGKWSLWIHNKRLILRIHLKKIEVHLVIKAT